MFKPPKNKILSENETISSYTSWQSNMLFHLSLYKEFANFIADDVEWSKKSVANRGLTDDGNDVEEDKRRNAVQKNIQLEHMLGYIAQHSPALLRNDIVKNSTSLKWIWQRIRKHYAFNQSEVHFLKIYTIVNYTKIH